MIKKFEQFEKPLKSSFGFLIVFIGLTNIYLKFNVEENEKLYLMEKATLFVTDEKVFEAKVREVSKNLQIPPEWLMAIMYSESRFDANAENLKGSGAIGLIQFMPATMPEFGLTKDKLLKMSFEEQLNHVEEYMRRKSKQYGGLKSLTDTYLAILYPKAIGKEMCYTLYSKPSKAYKQNVGLDENKDGIVTVGDIDVRMKRIFPKAYISKL